MFTHLDRK